MLAYSSAAKTLKLPSIISIALYNNILEFEWLTIYYALAMFVICIIPRFLQVLFEASAIGNSIINFPFGMQ